jgi:tetratricopeptide (TPR) repeat protein
MASPSASPEVNYDLEMTKDMDFEFEMSDNLTLKPEERGRSDSRATEKAAFDPLGPESLERFADGGLFSEEDLVRAKQQPDLLSGSSDLPEFRDLDEVGDLFERETLSKEPPAIPSSPDTIVGVGFELDDPDHPLPAGKASSTGSPRTEESGPTIDDIDFASLLDDLPSDSPRPSEQKEVFLVDSPSLEPAEFPMPSPGRKGGDSFSMEDLSLDDLSDSPASGTAPDEDSFDLDLGESHRLPELDKERAKLPRPQPVNVGETAPSATQRSRPRRSSAGKKFFASLLVAGSLAAAFYFMDPLGLFEAENPQKGSGQTTGTPALSRVVEDIAPMHFLNSPGEYAQAIAAALDDLGKDPGRKGEWEQELFWRLAWFRYFFPLQFESTRIKNTLTCTDLYSQSKGVGLPGNLAKRADAMELTVAAWTTEMESGAEAALPAWEIALRGLEQYLDTRDTNLGPDGALRFKLPWPYERILGEDNVLRARLLVKTGQLDKADPFLEKVTADLQNLSALLIDAEAQSVRARLRASVEGDAGLDRAINQFQLLDQRFPTSLGSTNELIRLLMARGKDTEAIDLTRQYMARARENQCVSHQLMAFHFLDTVLKKAGGDSGQRMQLLEELLAFYRENPDRVQIPEAQILEVVAFQHQRSIAEPEQASAWMVKADQTLKMCENVCTSAHYFVTSAKLFQSQGLREKAQAVIQQGLALDNVKQDVSVRLFLAELYESDGLLKKAIVELESVLELTPDHLAATMKLATLYRQEKELSQAMAVLVRGSARFSGSLELHSLMADLATELNDRSRLMTALGKILELQPDNHSARQVLAKQAVQEGDYQGASRHFDVLRKHKLVTPDLGPFYGKMLKETGQTEEAVVVFRQLMESDPGDIESARFLADIYLQRDDCTNALVFLQKVRRINDKTADVHSKIADCCARLANLECAEESLEKALTLAPENLDYMTRYANTLFTVARERNPRNKDLKLKRALSLFDHVVKEREKTPGQGSPKDLADVYYHRGIVRFESGRFAEAREDFGKAGYYEQYRYDILLKFADSLFRTRNLKDAERYYLDLVESGYQAAHAHFHLGMIQVRWKNRQKAKEHFVECIRLDPAGFPDAYRYLGDIYRETGMKKMARDSYLKFLDLVGPNSPAAADVQGTLRHL